MSWLNLFYQDLYRSGIIPASPNLGILFFLQLAKVRLLNMCCLSSVRDFTRVVKLVQLLLLGIAVVDPFNTLKLLISLAKSSCLQCLTIACKIILWAICLQESPNSHHIDSFNHSNWLETGFIRWVLSNDFVSQWEKWLPYYFHIGVNLSVRESQSSSVARSCGSDPCEEHVSGDFICAALR